MVRVKILLFGVLREIVGRGEDELLSEEARTPSSILDEYCQRFETLRNSRSSILIARNREFTAGNELVTDGDEIAFLPPVSGGSSPVQDQQDGHVFEITRAPIDTRALVRRLLQGEDGALVIFEGVVRNNTKGRPTRYLEYECYEAMALPHMSRIGREIAATNNISRIGIIHRLGRLEIGEASVVIVACSPHRKQAFAAAHEAIDRLKREVPIWKKEFFADGAIWAEGEWDERLVAGLRVEP
jgi:molybdopterin synthase catalytic subunit